MNKGIDLFAGAGGWDIAATALGWDMDGVEIWAPANATRAAAGLKTVHEDVTTFHAESGAYRLGIASPSCKRYSMAGNGNGRRALEHVLAGVRAYARGDVHEFAEARDLIGDADAALTLEPLRIFLACEPEFIALEQVPAVLPVWHAYAEVLRERGYSATCAILNAEQYGVPQTRRRAVLIARRDGTEARMPEPTHSRYWNRDPKRLDADVKPWVSMAEALGWDDEFTFRQNNMRNATIPDGGVPAPTITSAKDWRERVWVVSNYGTGGDPANRGERDSGEPFAAVTSKADRFKVVASKRMGAGMEERHGSRPDRPAESPAFTVRADAGGMESGGWRWKLAFRNNNQGNACVREENAPSGTIFAGRRANWMGWERADNGDFVHKVTPAEAAAIQTFPDGYPFQGGKSQVMTQIGNAVPPLLAEAILGQFQPRG